MAPRRNIRSIARSSWGTRGRAGGLGKAGTTECCRWNNCPRWQNRRDLRFDCRKHCSAASAAGWNNFDSLGYAGWRPRSDLTARRRRRTCRHSWSLPDSLATEPGPAPSAYCCSTRTDLHFRSRPSSWTALPFHTDSSFLSEEPTTAINFKTELKCLVEQKSFENLFLRFLSDLISGFQHDYKNQKVSFNFRGAIIGPKACYRRCYWI